MPASLRQQEEEIAMLAPRKAIVATLIASTALLFSACAMPADDPNFVSAGGVGGDASANASADAAGSAALEQALAAPTSIGVDKPLSALPKLGATIISLTDGSSYEAVMETAMAEAAKKLGWTVTSVTVDPADPAAVAKALDDAVAQKPSGIHIRGEFFDALTEGLTAANSSGIPIVCTGCSGEPSGAIKDTSLNGTEQNKAWADAMAAYVVASQYSGEAAGVQIFTVPGGAVNDFNTEFDTALLSQCRECSTGQSIVDPATTNFSDSAAVADFVGSEMGSVALGAWALLDSGVLSSGVAAGLASNALLMTPVVLTGLGAGADDITALKSIGSGASSSSNSPSDGVRTPEQAAALQAWMGIPMPVLGWRVVDQFARIFDGDALATGLLPSQLLTGTTVGSAVLDSAGNFVGISDYPAQFSRLWGVN